MALARVGKWIGLAVVALAVVVVALVFFYRPSARALTELKVEVTPERVARGTYLAEHVLECAGCHTRSDHTKYASPPIGKKGAGGDCFEEAYTPGGSIICVPNITPHPEAGVGRWTDDELARAIRDGIDRHGDLLYSLMRSYSFRYLSDEDLYAVIAWMRSLDPVAEAAPPTRMGVLTEFMSGLVFPAPVEGVVAHPDPADTVAMGRYLTRIGGCLDCHTMFSPMHEPLMDEELAGGEVFPTTMGPIRAANLTLHPTSNVAKSPEAFVARFHGARGVDVAVGPGGQTIMPWLEMAGMTGEDLRAIYAYLETVPHFDRQVMTFVGAVGDDYAATSESPTCDDVRARLTDGRPWPQLFRSCRDDAATR